MSAADRGHGGSYAARREVYPLVPLRSSCSSRDVPPASDLLLILDGLVQRDGPLSGLRGEVCVGVRGDGGFRWWRARFGKRFRTDFLDRRPQSATATLFMAESDARALLADGAMPADPELFSIDGDRSLLAQFFKRYTSRSNWLGVRLGSF